MRSIGFILLLLVLFILSVTSQFDTEVPTELPTEAPSDIPTDFPTEVPTEFPTEAPTEEAAAEAPTVAPTDVPAENPSEIPTEFPTEVPTEFGTEVPSQEPTEAPSMPTVEPSIEPTVIANIMMNVASSLDYIAVIEDCYPIPSPNCTLRSAWSACNLFTSETECQINLTISDPIYFDSNLGSLSLNPTSNIVLIGNNAQIIRIGQEVSTSTISDDGEDFPLTTGTLSQTASATQNYRIACVQGCPDDLWTFSSCSSGSTTQDTYFRLFYNNTQVATNDDYCGYSSQIVYTVTQSVCSNLCLHVGCYGSSTCSTVVTAKKETAQVISDYDPRFISYYSDDSSTLIPTLIVSDITLQQFGDFGYDGGVVYLSGDVDVTFQRVVFYNNTGDNGGAIGLEYNEYGSVTIDSCMFNTINAINGGGIAAVDNVFGLKVLNSTFVNCIVENYGGGIYLYDNNIDAVISDCQFKLCHASNAAAISLYTNNQYIVIHNIIVSDCTSSSSGGAIHIYNSNLYVTISNGTFERITTQSQGGAIYSVYNNHYLEILSTVFTHCHCVSGGGVLSLYVNNDYFVFKNSSFMNSISASKAGCVNLNTGNSFGQIHDSLFYNCTSTTSQAGCLYATFDNYYLDINNCKFDLCVSMNSDGGCIELFANNYRATISNSILSRGQSSLGGGVMLAKNNTYVTIINTLITNSQASSSGGAIFMYDSNYHFSVINTTISYCTALSNGGAMYVQVSNKYVTLINVNMIHNTASYSGGGMYVYGLNDHLYIDNCTISNNIASRTTGGGIYIFQLNENATFLDTIISNNNAATYGGGIYCESFNDDLSIAGVQFISNSAGTSGGGLYILSNHVDFIVVDNEGYKSMQILQSAHPYTSYYPVNGVPYVIFAANVSVPSACGFLIKFDPLSNIFSTNSFAIYTNYRKTTLLFGGYGVTNWPGKNAPILHIMYSSFYVEFAGPVNDRYVLPTNYYGFKMYIYPITANPQQMTLFQNNHAVDGAGMFMYFSNLFPVFINTNVIGNFASGSGGGFLLRNANTGAAFQQMEFIENTAMIDGAAMLFSSAHYGNSFYNCNYSSNVAYGSGGSIALVTDNGGGMLAYGNALDFNGCMFNNNTAKFGGAINADNKNILLLSNCEFAHNSATSGNGGSVELNQYNTLNMTATGFYNNRAALCGGAVSSEVSNIIKFTNSELIDNSALTTGGGLCIGDTTQVVFNKTVTFESNSVSLAGGAIASFNSPMWLMLNDSKLILSSNTAARGSAIFLMQLQKSTNSMKNIQIQNNHASGGGTVFWLKDSIMVSEPSGLNSSTIHWFNNTAPFGNKTATQALQIIGPTAYNVTVYAQSLSPKLEYSLRDFYHQFIPITGITTVTVAIAETMFPPHCISEYPYLSGPNLFSSGVSMVSGYATFNQLEAYCYPNGNMTLIFTAQLGDAVGIGGAAASSYYISNYTFLQFRECMEGEYLSNGQCLKCATGTYNVDPSTQICTDCTTVDGISTCYANQIILLPGYWRRYPTSTTVLACPYAESSCIGGNLTGDSLCAPAYTGALCGVCADGYFLDGNICVQCTTSKFMTPTLIIYTVLAFFIFLFAVGIVAYKYGFFSIIMPPTADSIKTTDTKDTNIASVNNHNDNKRNDSIDDKPNSDEPVVPMTKWQLWWLWLKMKYGEFIVKIKIIVSTLQVVMSTAAIFHVTMPTSFTKLMSGINFLNLNFSSILPIGCSGTYTFIDALILTTLAPIGFAAILVICFSVEYSIKRRTIQANTRRQRGEKQRAFNYTKDKYFNYLFYLSYLILPAVTTTIFQTFICTNIDPSGEDSSNSDYYLTADLSISCTSPYYYHGLLYAIIMIIVYPIGVPAMYLVLLYRSRKDIQDRNKPKQVVADSVIINEDVTNPLSVVADVENNIKLDNSSVVAEANKVVDKQTAARMRTTSASSTNSDGTKVDDNVLPPHVSRLAFLWEAYKPEYWYWEVIETTRKIVLTAVLSVCGPGSAQQSILSVIFSLIYIKLYGFYNPYMNGTDNILAETGQFQIFFTFFGALVIQNSLLIGMQANALGVLLVMINMSVMCLAIYLELHTHWEEKRIMAEEFERMHAKKLNENSENRDSVWKKMRKSMRKSRKSKAPIRRQSVGQQEAIEMYRKQLQLKFEQEQQIQLRQARLSGMFSRNNGEVDSDDDEGAEGPRITGGIELTDFRPGAHGKDNIVQGIVYDVDEGDDQNDTMNNLRDSESILKAATEVDSDDE